MSGDFDCVLERKDATGNFNYNRTLDGLVRGNALQDAWQGGADRPGYTHYSVGSAARLDRIYISSDLLRRKQEMETLAAAFTDHMAVCLRMTVEEPIMRRGPGAGRRTPGYSRTRRVLNSLKPCETSSND